MFEFYSSIFSYLSVHLSIPFHTHIHTQKEEENYKHRHTQSFTCACVCMRSHVQYNMCACLSVCVSYIDITATTETTKKHKFNKIKYSVGVPNSLIVSDHEAVSKTHFATVIRPIVVTHERPQLALLPRSMNT